MNEFKIDIGLFSSLLRWWWSICLAHFDIKLLRAALQYSYLAVAILLCLVTTYHNLSFSNIKYFLRYIAFRGDYFTAYVFKNALPGQSANLYFNGLYFHIYRVNGNNYFIISRLACKQTQYFFVWYRFFTRQQNTTPCCWPLPKDLFRIIEDWL